MLAQKVGGIELLPRPFFNVNGIELKFGVQVAHNFYMLVQKMGGVNHLPRPFSQILKIS